MVTNDTAPKTLQEAIRYYSDLDRCQDDLAAARWPDGVSCPTCGRPDVSYLKTQRRWQCKSAHPKRQFSVKQGTIFEDSAIGLDKWFTAIWLIGSAKNGISSYELHRAIGVTQKTAWFMLHRIRLAMQTQSFTKMSGSVELDETYIGGKARQLSKWKGRAPLKGRATGKAGKTLVMGILERNSPDNSTVRTAVVRTNKRSDLIPHVTTNVESGAEVFTDALRSYDVLGQDYAHKVVDHAETYVDGQIHTNGLENFWALLKRAIRGTYVSVEPFHLFRYLDEQTFRFNTRKQKDGDRFADTLARVSGKRLTYGALIGALEPERA